MTSVILYTNFKAGITAMGWLWNSSDASTFNPTWRLLVFQWTT